MILSPAFQLLKTIYEHPWNRRHPFRAFFRLIRWQFHKRVSKKPRIYQFWSSRKIICHPGSQQSMYLIYNDIMDWEEFNFIRRFLRKSDCVIDVGANIGVYMLWMSQFVDASGKLIVFEPNPVNYGRCQDQLLLNSLDYVVLECRALADSNAAMRFSVGYDDRNYLIADMDQQEKYMLVEATTLDEYCRQAEIKKVDFLKIDVEGAEIRVLKGAKEILSNRKVEVIQFELDEQHLSRAGVSREELFGFLKERHYQIAWYDADKNTLNDVVSEKHFHHNMFAVRDIGYVNQRLSEVVLA